MQQRRLRLGDILDDYCPRERRITNHAVVAMVEDEVKQTRCTTCDAEHEYKQAKVPASRRRTRTDAPLPHLPEAPHPVLPASDEAASLEAAPGDTLPTPDLFLDAPPVDDPVPEPEPALLDDDGPVHRPLIRATLPRPEGHVPERKAPDFTVRQPGGRFDAQRNGQLMRGRNPARHAKDAGGQAPRFGNRQGPGPNAQAGHQGNRAGQPQGPRSGRPSGPSRGPRPGPGGGHGRKRGR
jgi:hypothetical protein